MMRSVLKRQLLEAGLLVMASSLGGDAEAQRAAEHRGGGQPPAYQRQRIVPPKADAGWDQGRPGPAGYHRTPHSVPRPGFRHGTIRPLVSHGAWFQRPYPYHLDYYRLRYGATYEPYFGGGVYGPPQALLPPAMGYGYGYGYGDGPFGPPAPRGDDVPAEDEAEP